MDDKVVGRSGSVSVHALSGQAGEIYGQAEAIGDATVDDGSTSDVTESQGSNKGIWKTINIQQSSTVDN